MVKKGAAALGDDVDSDDKLANKASEDDEKKIGGGGGGCGSGGNGKKSSDYSAGGGSMIICQVEWCTADLSDAKHYHRKHKVCEQHAKAPVVVVAGIRKRFCQQCSRFHELSEFDDSKRSCRRRLAGHYKRKRCRTDKANNCDDQDFLSCQDLISPKEAATGGWPGTTNANAKGRAQLTQPEKPLPRTDTANNCDDQDFLSDEDFLSCQDLMSPKEAAAGGWPGTTNATPKEEQS